MILVNKNGTLIHNKKVYKCAIGERGLTKQKKEGDKKTPVGIFSLGHVFYRADKIKNLKTKKRKFKIEKAMVWCDDPSDQQYNKLTFSKKKTKESLYRKDNLYDLIIVINYNIKPVIKNKGSAIFIHISKKNFSPTKGCVAIKKVEIKKLVKKIDKKTIVKII